MTAMRYELDQSQPGTYDPAPQGSGMWFENRLGKVTASRLNDMLDFRKDGKPGAKRLALLGELVDERMTGRLTQKFVSPAMQWGIDHEPIAARRYCEVTGNSAESCGFFDHPTINLCGASPDRLIGVDGLAEIKCPTTATYRGWAPMKECPDDYKPQMILQLECTGRQWCDFVAFDPRMPEGKQMRIWRYEPSDDERYYVMDEIEKFLAAVDLAFDELSIVEFEG